MYENLAMQVCFGMMIVSLLVHVVYAGTNNRKRNRHQSPEPTVDSPFATDISGLREVPGE